jgi:FkbM family methyltransferase
MDSEIINKRPFPKWGFNFEIGRSNDKEDDFVINYFKDKNTRRNRLVIDIGAADGLTGSNSRRLIVENNWDAILIEPFLPFYNYLNKLYENIKNVEILNYAADNDEKETFIFYRNNEEGVGLTSLINNWNDKQKINTKIFNNLIKQKNIDFLSLDVEGKELDILESINFDFYDIEIICVEKSIYDQEYNKKMINFLEYKNYNLIKITNHNYIFVKQ